MTERDGVSLHEIAMPAGNARQDLLRRKFAPPGSRLQRA
jgi:hypothetical protein